MNAWMVKAIVWIVLLIFISVHCTTMWLVVNAKITGEMYLGTWGTIAGTSIGGLLMWLKQQTGGAT